MITISQPIPTEAEAIHKLIKDSWYATYINDVSGITREDIDAIYTPEIEKEQIELFRSRAEHIKSEDLSLVAKEDNTVVGFIRLKLYDKHSQLLSLYVHPSCVARGIGGKLWLESLTLLPKQKPVFVEVAMYTKAVDFYKKVGFVDTGERSFGGVMEVSKKQIPLMKLVFRERNT